MLGRHALAKVHGASFEALNDFKNLERSFRDTVAQFQLQALGEPHLHQFEPQGLTGMILLSESHISIHTWPEYGTAAVDVFTCGGRDSSAIAYFFCKTFCECEVEIRLVDR